LPNSKRTERPDGQRDKHPRRAVRLAPLRDLLVVVAAAADMTARVMTAIGTGSGIGKGTAGTATATGHGTSKYRK
jgi:hypothetical protein